MMRPFVQSATTLDLTGSDFILETMLISKVVLLFS